MSEDIESAITLATDEFASGIEQLSEEGAALLQEALLILKVVRQVGEKVGRDLLKVSMGFSLDGKSGQFDGAVGGIVSEYTFLSTVSMVHKSLKLPKIEVKAGMSRKIGSQEVRGVCLEIGANSEGGSSFNHRVLESVESVRIWQDGTLESYSNGKSSLLDPEQAEELRSKLTNIRQDIQQRFQL